MAKTGKGLPRSLENTDFSSVVPEATAVATSAQTAVNAVGTKLNALLAQLRAAGVIES